MHQLNKRLTKVSNLNGRLLLKLGSTIFFLSLLFISGCSKIGEFFDHHNIPLKTDLKLVADGLVSPVTLVDAFDGSHRLFAVDQVGKIWIISKNGKKSPTPFLDISSKLVSLNPGYDERGLLGLAFHPDFKKNGRFFVFYTIPPEGGPTPSLNNVSRISEFNISNKNEADMSSEKILLEVDHPQSNHNGGTIAFGPDGYLYISIGDGGNKNDIGPGHVTDWYTVNEGGNGQDVEANLLGNILRIDVNTKSPGKEYGIPPDNPFTGKPGEDEIYAYGFRNPYRFSFDLHDNHWLIAGDAGQSLYEEIDVVTKGGNYGWNVREGRHCFNASDELMERPSCPMVDVLGIPLTDPVIEIKNHDNPMGGIATAVVAGNVYRGHEVPQLYGKYIFGILSQEAADGKILVSNPSTSPSWSFDDLKLESFPENLGQYVKGFGQDETGEVYVLTSSQIGPQGTTGKVYKLVAVF